MRPHRGWPLPPGSRGDFSPSAAGLPEGRGSGGLTTIGLTPLAVTLLSSARTNPYAKGFVVLARVLAASATCRKPKPVGCQGKDKDEGQRYGRDMV